MSQDQISTKYKGIIVALSLLCLSSLFVCYPKTFLYESNMFHSIYPLKLYT